MHAKLKEVMDQACEALPRSEYARNVVRGRQRWSGADLKGKAKKYSSSYAVQRGNAAYAFRSAGGVLLFTENNRIRSAVMVCTDDYGNAVYATTKGYAKPRSRHQCRHF